MMSRAIPSAASMLLRFMPRSRIAVRPTESDFFRLTADFSAVTARESLTPWSRKRAEWTAIPTQPIPTEMDVVVGETRHDGESRDVDHGRPVVAAELVRPANGGDALAVDQHVSGRDLARDHIHDLPTPQNALHALLLHPVIAGVQANATRCGNRVVPSESEESVTLNGS